LRREEEEEEEEEEVPVVPAGNAAVAKAASFCGVSCMLCRIQNKL